MITEYRTRHRKAHLVWSAVLLVLAVLCVIGAGCSFALAAMGYQVLHHVAAGLVSLGSARYALREASRQRTKRRMLP